MLKHFVVTRLGLAVYSERVLDQLIDIFDLVTLPSMLRQTTKDFTWLIVVDSKMPQASRERIARLLDSAPGAHLLEIDVTALTHVRQGCFDWVWDKCQDFILNAGLIDHPGEYIITSVLDADDAWHVDTLRLVQKFMRERLAHVCSDLVDRGTWLHHTQGIAATFKHGYKWFIATNTWEHIEQRFMSMSVFVAARFSSGISACSSRHMGWEHYCKVVGFSEHVLEQDNPMWIWVRHNRATQPWTVAAVSLDATSGSELGRNFGIDWEAVLHWQSSSCERGSLVHPGRSASDQHDRIFQIAGLNREIAALTRRRSGFPVGSELVASLNEKISRKRLERAGLVETLRAGETEI